MSKTATVLRHVHFEDLGSLYPILASRGFSVTYRDVGAADFLDFDPLQPDLLIVLGGPIGVYESDAYPFVVPERELIARRLAAWRPTLGICLGAQFIAAALESRVFPAGGKEIGFAPVALTRAGAHSPLRHLEGVPVLHWHGDTYELPRGATNLASAPLVEQQAFVLGTTVLGLQFHAEVDARTDFERWLVGHAAELAAARIDLPKLRADAERHGAALVAAAQRVFSEWLDTAL